MTFVSKSEYADRLKQLNAIGASLSSTKNLKTLLENILKSAQDITHADGGTLYLVTPDSKHLRFEISHNTSLGNNGAKLEQLTKIPLYDEQDGSPNKKMIAAYSAISKKTVNIENAYEAQGFDFSGTKEFDEKNGYQSISFLTVPLVSHEEEVIGILQLINALNKQKHPVPFSEEDQSLAESLAAQASIVITNRLLIDQLEKLFESFITLINDAIDEKSHYTAGHCQRVPELTMMIAEAVHKTTEGPLANFQMTDQDRHELKIAGLLHDCGKITTPVHVVDKATKLETICDRIHLIKTRFEVIKRDIEIDTMRKIMSKPGINEAEEQTLWKEARAEIQKIDNDIAFLSSVNKGSETMSEVDQNRIRSIAEQRKWRGPDGILSPCLSNDEVENLTIRSGTLNEDERKIINGHIVSTINMLEKLPWPKHLTNVPEYAGGHHERMDGQGYPKGLTREQMSVQARIMGIADIFEALTAKDRPYKDGKTLSEAVTILGKMKLNGHIDPDIFDIFIKEQVFKQYGEDFLDSYQIDNVDMTKVPGYNS